MSSANDPSRAARLVSQLLLQDGDLRDIVVEFVDGLTARMGELRTAHEKLDWDQLTTLAHRLKGAAGSYGYPEISHLCAEMEQKFRQHEAEQFTQWVTELNALVSAAKEGLADGP